MESWHYEKYGHRVWDWMVKCPFVYRLALVLELPLHSHGAFLGLIMFSPSFVDTYGLEIRTIVGFTACNIEYNSSSHSYSYWHDLCFSRRIIFKSQEAKKILACVLTPSELPSCITKSRWRSPQHTSCSPENKIYWRRRRFYRSELLRQFQTVMSKASYQSARASDSSCFAIHLVSARNIACDVITREIWLARDASQPAWSVKI